MSPGRAVSVSVFTAWVAGSLVMALELPRRVELWAGVPLVLTLGALAGGLAGLLLAAVPRRHAGWLLMLPLLWTHAQLDWAMSRMPRVLDAQTAFLVVWITAGALATGVAVGRVVGGSAAWRRFYGVVAALAVVVPLGQMCLFVFKRWRVSLPLTLGLVGVLMWRQAFKHKEAWARLPALGALLVSGLALLWLPAAYPRLGAMCAEVATLSLLLASPWPSVAAHRSRRAFALLALTIAGACFAHWTVVTQPAAFRDARSDGGPLSAAVHELRALSDFDNDQDGAWLGQVDCDPFDATVSVQRHEVLANGRDDNCRGGDGRVTTGAFLRSHGVRNPAPPPFAGDIIMVIVDTLRYDRTVGEAAPAEWRRLRERGVFYTNAQSTSTFTTSVLATIVGGRFATSVPLHFVGPFASYPAEPLRGLPVWLSLSGYATGASVSFEGTSIPVYTAATHGAGLDRVVMSSLANTTSAPVMADARRVWADMPTDRPRFLLVHALTPHAYTGDPETYRRATREALIATAELYDAIGHEALFVVVADHGEEFGEHGGVNHAMTLFDEVIHVPLLVVRPDLSGGEVASLTSVTQLVPTLLAAARPDLVAGEHGPFLCQPGAPCADAPIPMALERPGAHWHGLRLGARVVLRDIDEGVLTFFDMASDPGQQHPVASDASLLDALVAWEDAYFVEASAESFWPYAAPSPRPSSR